MEDDFKKKKIDAYIELALEEILLSEEQETEDEEAHEFSPKFERKMRRLIRKNKRIHYFKSRKPIVRAASIIIVCLIGINLSIITSSALRIPVRNFMLEIKDKYFVLDTRTNNRDVDAIRNESFKALIPSYMIEGYGISEIIEDANLCIIYENGEGGWYDFKIFTGAPSNAIDGATSIRKIITVKGYTGVLVMGEDKSNAFLEYKDLQIELIGNISEDEIMNILKSID